ncbi:membrane protein, partial [Bacillus toyonensis]|nr:membrane protein [Bacillus toyonensis]
MTEPLFIIPLWADLLGVGLGGVQGAMFASGFQGQRRLDLLGVSIIGIMIGMGGGLIRDILIGQPPATLQSNWYLITAGGASLVGMLLAGVLHRVNTFIVVLDAVVIGMFGAFGVSKAITFGIPPVPAVFIGVCAAAGGGV